MREISLKTTLAFEAADIIRRRILTKKYVPNQHLTETSLAEELEISRGPVREAMMILENEGLIYTPLNGRKIVAGFDESDMEDYHEIRCSIEIMAVKKIINNNNINDIEYKEWINDLEKLLILMEKSINNKDSNNANKYDYIFHEEIIKRANNKVVQRIWNMISGIRVSIMQINERMFKEKTIMTYEDFYNMHKDIFIGLKEKDLEFTKSSIYIHMDLGTKMYKNIINNIKHN